MSNLFYLMHTEKANKSHHKKCISVPSKHSKQNLGSSTDTCTVTNTNTVCLKNKLSNVQKFTEKNRNYINL